jgi:hypothetical protein
MQRKEKLAKMASSRTIMSGASIDVGIASLGERSSLLTSAGLYREDDDDEDMDGSQRPYQQNYSGRIPTVIIKSNGVSDDQEDDTKSVLMNHPTPLQAVYGIFFRKGILSWMLLASPFAILAYYLKWNDTIVFCLNFVVLIPLASILSDFTEEAALHTNETIGGTPLL